MGPAYGAMPASYGVDRRALTSAPYLSDYNQLAMAAIPRARELSSSPTIPAGAGQPGAEGYTDGYSE